MTRVIEEKLRMPIVLAVAAEAVVARASKARSAATVGLLRPFAERTIAMADGIDAKLLSVHVE